jgi:hypothetical protein
MSNKYTKCVDCYVNEVGSGSTKLTKRSSHMRTQRGKKQCCGYVNNLLIRICGSEILNYGSESGRATNYGSGF